MSHDDHFLDRSVDFERISYPAMERAMVLYQDPKLVRFIIEQARLPEGLEDVAIALTGEESPPHLIVHRSGHFVTILGPGMVVTDAVVLTYQRFEHLTERMADLRERLAAAEKLSAMHGSAGNLILRLMRAGCYLSREEFVAISHWQPLLRDFFLHVFNIRANDLELARLRIRRFPPKQLLHKGDVVLHNYWNNYFLLWHLALLIAMDSHRHTQPLPVPIEKRFDYFTRWLFRLGTVGAALRSAWVAGEFGKDIFTGVKRRYMDAQDGWDIYDSATGLLGIAARRPKTCAEITKILDAPLHNAALTDREGAVQAVEVFQLLVESITHPSPELEASWKEESWRAFLRLHPKPPGSRVELTKAEFCSAGLQVAAAAHVQLDLRSDDGIIFLFGAIPYVAVAEPKQLYFPEDTLSTLRRAWRPSDALGLLSIQEQLLGKPEPARATSRPGRNDPCPCGSGKKYKKCCEAGAQES